jgi:hypothetical protein
MRKGKPTQQTFMWIAWKYTDEEWMRISQIILPEGMKENKKLIRRKDVKQTEGRRLERHELWQE